MATTLERILGTTGQSSTPRAGADNPIKKAIVSDMESRGYSVPENGAEYKPMQEPVEKSPDSVVTQKNGGDASTPNNTGAQEVKTAAGSVEAQKPLSLELSSPQTSAVDYGAVPAGKGASGEVPALQGMDRMTEYLERKRDEYNRKEEKKEKIAATIAALSDGVASFANLYHTTKGSPHIAMPMLSQANRERMERLKADRDKANKDMWDRFREQERLKMDIALGTERIRDLQGQQQDRDRKAKWEDFMNPFRAKKVAYEAEEAGHKAGTAKHKETVAGVEASYAPVKNEKEVELIDAKTGAYRSTKGKNDAQAFAALARAMKDKSETGGKYYGSLPDINNPGENIDFYSKADYEAYAEAAYEFLNPNANDEGETTVTTTNSSGGDKLGIGGAGKGKKQTKTTTKTKPKSIAGKAGYVKGHPVGWSVTGTGVASNGAGSKGTGYGTSGKSTGKKGKGSGY